MKNLKGVLPYIYKYRWRLFLGILFTALSNLFAVFTPAVVRHATDTALGNTTSTTGEKLFSVFGTTIFSFAILILTFSLLRGLFLFFMRQTIIVMSRKIEYDQKNDLFRHYEKLPMSFYKKNNTGDLMNRMTEDISRVRMFTGPTIMYAVNLISVFVLAIIMMWKQSPTLTLFAVIPIPLMGILIFYMSAIIERKSEKIQEQLSNLTTFVQESFSGIRLLKSYVQEKQMSRFFGEEANQYKKKNLSLARAEAVYFPIVFLLVGLSNILTVYIGGRLVIATGPSHISPGNIPEFIMYINMLTMPMVTVGWTMALAQRAGVSQRRIDEFMKIKPEISSQENALSEKIIGNVEFKNVSLVYENTGTVALKNISFKLKAGEKMAVIGRVGSGKTTLAQLLIRLYDVNEGEILVDEKNINDRSVLSLRKQIGFVSQDVFLFSESVADNISFGLENDFANELERRNKITEVANSAAVYDEIISLPKKFETVVGERGVTLSGGQKQRISIARALIKEPPILILDDCLSAVDAKTEKTILTHLQTRMVNKTAIIITHRIFSLLKFDKIIFLEDGKIIEEGIHDELIKQKGAYAELYQLQMMEEVE